ncbi:MAG TPA: signal peptidase I, partial [Flavipsychrobacter sp.]|nr:signal peptidase I [Flavipsychrobacter sp.]
KFGIALGISILVFVAAFVAARLTKVADMMRISSGANLPTLEVGKVVWVSKLAKPQRFDFVSYYAETAEYGRQVWLHRLCALEGDQVEVRDGRLYVNGKDADRNFTLSHAYITHVSNGPKLEGLLREENIYPISADSLVIHADKELLARAGIVARRYLELKGQPDPHISGVYNNSPWNRDHFGPVIVPAGYYFVLGDNRDNSLDSRYRGFVNKEDFAGTML